MQLLLTIPYVALQLALIPHGLALVTPQHTGLLIVNNTVLVKVSANAVCANDHFVIFAGSLVNVYTVDGYKISTFKPSSVPIACAVEGNKVVLLEMGGVEAFTVCGAKSWFLPIATLPYGKVVWDGKNTYIASGNLYVIRDGKVVSVYTLGFATDVVLCKHLYVSVYGKGIYDLTTMKLVKKGINFLLACGNYLVYADPLRGYVYLHDVPVLRLGQIRAIDAKGSLIAVSSSDTRIYLIKNVTYKNVTFAWKFETEGIKELKARGKYIVITSNEGAFLIEDRKVVDKYLGKVYCADVYNGKLVVVTPDGIKGALKYGLSYFTPLACLSHNNTFYFAYIGFTCALLEYDGTWKYKEFNEVRQLTWWGGLTYVVDDKIYSPYGVKEVKGVKKIEGCGDKLLALTEDSIKIYLPGYLIIKEIKGHFVDATFDPSCSKIAYLDGKALYVNGKFILNTSAKRVAWGEYLVIASDNWAIALR